MNNDGKDTLRKLHASNETRVLVRMGCFMLAVLGETGPHGYEKDSEVQLRTHIRKLLTNESRVVELSIETDPGDNLGICSGLSQDFFERAARAPEWRWPEGEMAAIYNAAQAWHGHVPSSGVRGRHPHMCFKPRLLVELPPDR